MSERCSTQGVHNSPAISTTVRLALGAFIASTAVACSAAHKNMAPGELSLQEQKDIACLQSQTKLHAKYVEDGKLTPELTREVIKHQRELGCPADKFSPFKAPETTTVRYSVYSMKPGS